MTRKKNKNAPVGGSTAPLENSGEISARNITPEFNPKSIVAFAALPSSDDLADLLVKLGADEHWAKLSSPTIVETLLRLSFDDVAPGGPEKAPILYEDRPKGMTPPQFLKTYYKDFLGTLTRRHLRAIDSKASQALYDWERRHPNDPELKDLDLPNLKEALDRQRPQITPSVLKEVHRIEAHAARRNSSGTKLSESFDTHAKTIRLIAGVPFDEFKAYADQNQWESRRERNDPAGNPYPWRTDVFEFIRDTYSSWIDRGQSAGQPLTQADIKSVDMNLYIRMHQEISKRDMPDWLNLPAMKDVALSRLSPDDAEALIEARVAARQYTRAARAISRRGNDFEG